MSNAYYRPSGFGRFSLFPTVIKNLLIINAAVFLIQMLMRNIEIDGTSGERIIIAYFALMPLDSSFFGVWQLLTYQFLHGDIWHIFFNMFALWMFGMEIENFWGSKKFLLYYLLCGIGAGLIHLFFTPLFGELMRPTLGASGAVYGVLIAFALMFPDRYIFLYFFIPVKAKYLVIFLILMDVMLLRSAGSNVAHLAHLGGALIGFLFIMFDKNTQVSLKNKFSSLRSSGFSSSGPSVFDSFKDLYKKTKKSETKVEDATFYDIVENDITQEEIDKILDKISQSGYQNLTEREKKILFEASKRM
jgi:membrane associated rhomboid family serine protease